MNILSKRNICIFMAFIIMIMSIQTVSFASDTVAAEADLVLINNISSLPFANFKSTETTALGLLTYEKTFYDEILDEEVIRFSSQELADGYSLYNTAGREARICILSTGTNFTETLYNQNKHKYMNLEFKILPENTTDGLAFRINRYNIQEDNTLALDTATAYYFAVGAENFSESVVANSNVTTGYSYTYKGLKKDEWHNVTIQLGADNNTNTIKFFVDGNQVVLNEKVHVYNTETKKEVKTKSTPSNVYTFPEGTSGFGSRSENYSVIVPKGTKGTSTVKNPFGIRISDFIMKATNSEYSYHEEEILPPKKVFELSADKELIRGEQNGITHETISSPHFAEEYNEKAFHIKSGESGYAVGTGGYTSGNYSQAGKAPGYYLIQNANETIGNVDYSKYKYLRVSFNIFINNETNGVYFRADRVKDGTVINDHNYIFGIGGSSFKTASTNSTIHSHIYKNLSLGRWHNVVIELGANAGNGTINYYVDGENVEFTYGKLDGVADTSFADITDLYGFGGTSQNRCILVPKANYGENLDLYLNDFVMLATNDKYSLKNNLTDIEISDTNDKGIKLENGIVYSYKNISDGDCSSLFETSGADYVGAIENGKYILLYNEQSKTFKYYDVVSVTDADIPYTEGLHADNITVSTNGNETIVKADAYNLTDDYSKNAKLVVTYFKDDILVECFIKDISFDDKLFYINEKIARKTQSYDTLKAFIWSDLSNMTMLGECATEK